MFSFNEVAEQAKTFFKDHIATMTVHDGLNVLEWSKPGTNNGRMNFVFHKNFVYVSGDMREAVYDCTWKTSLGSCANTDFGYFNGKLSCATHGKKDWDSDKLLKDVEQWKKEALERFEDYEDFDMEKFEEFIEDALYHADSPVEWQAHLMSSELDEYDEYCESALWKAGEYTNQDLIYNHVALKMANAQINKVEG